MPTGPVNLEGELSVPASPLGMVLFAHGSGSSRHSTRNRFVADQLNAASFATLLFDLLTTAEERDRGNVFDIHLLAFRLRAATEWLSSEPEGSGMSFGYFGASTGAGAALSSAADLGPAIGAVVSRGGRPDLAGDKLALVRAPTLLIVGGRDPVVERLNEEAAGRLECEKRLLVIPGATHLFEEPGMLDEVARLATSWFGEHLR